MMAQADPQQPQLTDAEERVFRLIMRGKDVHEIADILGRSYDTVRLHKASIRAKLGGHGAGSSWWITLARAYERSGGEVPPTGQLQQN